MRCVKCLSATVVVATLVVACPILAARAWDDDKRYVRVSDCGDANADLSKDQFPSQACLEGHGCVVCHMDMPPRGDIIHPTGNGLKLWLPQEHGCSGQRRIGICTGSGTGEHCDQSDYTVDGECSGVVKEYQQQPQGQPPGGS